MPCFDFVRKNLVDHLVLLDLAQALESVALNGNSKESPTPVEVHWVADQHLIGRRYATGHNANHSLPARNILNCHIPTRELLLQFL